MGNHRLNISIIVNEVHTYGEPWSPDSTMLGGTEESVVEWAKRLKERGHSVEVFYDGPQGDWYNVAYKARSQYAPRGVTLNVKSLDIPRQEPTAYLTNETDIAQKDVSSYDSVILPTVWAQENLGLRHENVVIVPHGYDSTKIKGGPKVPKQVLYASSPDRGLALLLKCWKDVAKYHPDATLIVTYGYENKNNLAIPNLMALGRVDEETMVELYNSSDIWAHPCSGGELYGITGVKAQAAGCVPVYFPTMALSETVRHGISSDPEHFTGDLVRILGDGRGKEEIRAALANEHFPDWDDSTTALEQHLTEISAKPQKKHKQ